MSTDVLILHGKKGGISHQVPNLQDLELGKLGFADTLDFLNAIKAGERYYSDILSFWQSIALCLPRRPQEVVSISADELSATALQTLVNNLSPKSTCLIPEAYFQTMDETVFPPGCTVVVTKWSAHNPKEFVGKAQVLSPA
jgi:hypothetical protein